jgi:hypothetical protein
LLGFGVGPSSNELNLDRTSLRSSGRTSGMSLALAKDKDFRIDDAPSSVEPFRLSPGRWLSDLKLLLLKQLMWLTASLAAH